VARSCGRASLFGASIGPRASEGSYLLVNEWDTAVRTVLRSQAAPRTSSWSRTVAVHRYRLPYEIIDSSICLGAILLYRHSYRVVTVARFVGEREECPVPPRRRLVVPSFQVSGV
jgi:hypothetical protein